jgi:hypothetical protein
LKITKRQQMVGAHKARHEEKEAHVRSLRAAALASVEGAAAFAWAYWVLIAGSHRGPQRGDFNRELILALTRATRKLQGDQRRYVNWVLRCAAALQSQLQRSVRRRSDGNFSERPFLRPCVKH